MRADPGGQVELGEAIGREGEVEQLWSTLVDHSVILEARRGMGKTTLVRLALNDGPTGWSGRRVALAELSGASSAAAAIIDAIWSEHPGPKAKLRAAVEPLLGDHGHVSSEVLEDDWSKALRAAINAQIEDHEGVGLVLALDDFDRFCARSQADRRGTELSELLADLASLLDAQPRLRLLVVSNTNIDRLPLRVSPRLPAEPLARCTRLTIDGLAPESGARLVTALLLGESITARDRAALARHITERCDHVPRWIHCALTELASRGKPIDEAELGRCFTEAVADLEAEPWTLRRELAPVLDDYWEPQRGLALAILDLLTGEDEGGALAFPELRRRLAAEMTIDEDAVRRVIDELGRDQIVEEFGGRLRFAGQLLRQAWVSLRGLEASS